VEIAQDDIRVLRPMNYAWLQIPTPLEKIAKHSIKGGLQYYELAEEFKEELLETGVIE